MIEKGQLVGEYTIEKVNKNGEREVVFKKHNRLTDMFKSYILSLFSNVFNGAYYTKGATNGELRGVSGFINSNLSQRNAYYYPNSLCLYGMNETVETAEFNNYPFLTGVREIDYSKLTFIGSDNDSGDFYAQVIPTEYINMLVPNTISKSWKLTGPNGLGTIKTLCIGTNVHTELTDATSLSSKQNQVPMVSKVLSASYIDDSNAVRSVTGYLPIIEGFNNNKFYFGTYGTSLGTVFNSYNINTDTYKAVSSSDAERNYPLAPIGNNIIKYGDFLYTGYTNNQMIYKYDIVNKTWTSAGWNNSSTFSNVFKKGNLAICNSPITGRSYEGSIHVVNMDTGERDTSLFGTYAPALEDVVKNKPKWFNVEYLGTRNDNENWLVFDSYKGICIECTDVNDVLGSFVKMYYTPTIIHTIINGKIYWLWNSDYQERGVALTDTMTGGGSQNSSPIQIIDSDIPSNMFSIITDITDSQGNDIIQTEDTEYIFTYTLRFV